MKNLVTNHINYEDETMVLLLPTPQLIENFQAGNPSMRFTDDNKEWDSLFKYTSASHKLADKDLYIVPPIKLLLSTNQHMLSKS